VRFTSLAFLLTWLGLACEPGNQLPDGPGEMTVQWTGSVDGSMTAPASATWCEVQRLLEIRSIRGDTGIALALYPTRKPTAGSYPILEPARAESLPPAAGVAVRWLARNVVQGFRGDSGRLQLERSSSGKLSGQLQARARSVVDTQRIRLTADFRNLTPRPDTLNCTPVDSTEDAGGAGDTMVD
jgi:hypothetical protein